MKVGINGLGRIGRQVFRSLMSHDGLDVVHVNDLADAETLAHLLQFDTTYGRWDATVRAEGDVLQIDNTSVSVSSREDPAQIPWGDNDVDIVLEATGQFRKKVDAADHIKAGAKKVLISAPGRSLLDGEYVIGVNDELYERKEHNIISVASCTTNCLAPVAKVIHEEFGIDHGLINTTHAYTSSQHLLDSPNSKIRRGRAAAENLVPTSTGAAAAIGLILPELEGKLKGLAVRAPLKCGSLLDFTCTVNQETTAEQVNDRLRAWSDNALRGILAVDDRALVSSDIIGTHHSAIVTSQDTYVAGGKLVKVLAWYDNEGAFAQRCIDMMAKML